MSSKNQLTTCPISCPVVSAKYFNGPSSRSSSLDISKSNILESSDMMESCTTSNFTLRSFLSRIVLSNSFCNALLDELDVVVINNPDSASTYWTCAGLESDILKSDMDLFNCSFSNLRSVLFSSNLVCFISNTANDLSKNSDLVAVSWYAPDKNPYIPPLVISMRINTAIDKYIFRNLLMVSQYWYNKDATTSFANSNEPAIIITCVLAPANSLLNPNTE